MKKFGCFAILLALLLLGGSAASARSALLVANGLSGDLDSICLNDALAMQAVLAADGQYASVELEQNITKEGLRQLIESVPRGEDFLLYFSGAAQLSGGGVAEAALRAADNGVITAGELKSWMDGISGKKILILDASHSGNLINKGASGAEGFIEAFVRESKAYELMAEGYYVLAATSSVEKSYALPGETPMSAFTAALASGLGVGGRLEADSNGDGSVTLLEARDYARRQNLWSKAQLYPENANLTLLTASAEKALISDMRLSAREEGFEASFTLNNDSRLLCMVVAVQGGSGAMAHQLVTTLPVGTRAFMEYSAGAQTLQWEGSDDSGDIYLAIAVEGEEQWLYYPFARAASALELKVFSTGTLRLGSAMEVPISVGYSGDCFLDVLIVDGGGEPVRVLAIQRQAIAYRRPDGAVMTELFYWDGKDDSGRDVQPGIYTARVSGGKAGASVDIEVEPEEG